MFITREEYGLYKRAFSDFILHHLKSIIILFALTLVTSILELIPLYYFGKILDYVVNKEIGQIIKILLLIFVLFLLNSGLSFCETYLHAKLSNKLIFTIKRELFRKILYLSVEDHEQRSIGEFISRIEGDANAISSFFISRVLNILISMCTLIFTTIFIFKISFTMSIIASITFPLSAILYWFYGKKVRSIQEMMKKLNDSYYDTIQESLSGYKEIRNLTIENKVFNIYSMKGNDLIKVNIKSSLVGAFSGLSNMTLNTIMQLVLTSIGCWKIISGTLTIGLYVAFNAYLQRFIGSLQSLASMNIQIQETLVSVKRIYEIMDSFEEKDTDNKLSFNSGNIEIDNLKFRYPKASNYTLNGINLSLLNNSLTVLVGPNGCGKSTLLKILMKYYNNYEGAVMLDSINQLSFSVKTIRQNITYIQQDPFFFNTSIRQNLLFANEDASEEDLIRVCRITYSYDFIQSLANGLDTVIGSNGIKLSGGQKQRLAIARGLLRKSKVFLLDEITSDVDSEIEGHIIKLLRELKDSYTVVMVAHRLSTIINVPNIVVINDGLIVSKGKHSQLIEKCSVYKKLYQEQILEYKKSLSIT